MAVPLFELLKAFLHYAETPVPASTSPLIMVLSESGCFILLFGKAGSDVGMLFSGHASDAHE